MQMVATAKKPRKQAISGRFWAGRTYRRRIKDDHKIDYACGAGHFLTEAVEAINHFVHSDGDNAWTRDHIYGIEKDYRLARVAKISLFMNGAGEGNIRRRKHMTGYRRLKWTHATVNIISCTYS